MRSRWYSPALAQFLSPDPLGYVDETNPYAYAANDPVNRVDPFGLGSHGQADAALGGGFRSGARGMPRPTPDSSKSMVGTLRTSLDAGIKAIVAFNTGRNAGIRAAYTAADAFRAQGTVAAMRSLRSFGLSPSEAATAARAASAARNEARQLAQQGLSGLGKMMSRLWEQDRSWGAIVKKENYGNPSASGLSSDEVFAMAERIALKTGSTNRLMTTISRGTVGLGAAIAGWQIGYGIKLMRNGKAALGAVEVVEGATDLALMAVGLTAGESGALASAGVGAGVGALGIAATVAAGGSLTLAFDSARSGVSGEQSALEVADEFYGTGFSDIYAWQQRSTTARVVLGFATSGLSEAWYTLNELGAR